MVHVAKEMTREGFNIPLLIGGATTSKVHTSVKIEPHYNHPVVHVNDASRSVPVVSNLLSADLRENYILQVKAEHARTREYHKSDRAKAGHVSLDKARENKFSERDTQIVKPAFTGIKVFEDYSLEEIASYIDWTPFFISWEMKGSYPKILQDQERGAEATKLFNDAQQMLRRIISEKWLTAKAVIGIFPAVSKGDDIIVSAPSVGDKTKSSEQTYVFHTLRQQSQKSGAEKNLALAD